MLPDEFSTLVRSRHSVRDFRPDPIDEATLAAILDDARHSPSWSNTRPYCVAVATGDQLDRLRVSYGEAFDASVGLQRRSPAALVRAALLRQLPDGDFRTWRRYPDDLRPRSIKIGKALYAHLGIDRGDLDARDAQNRRNCEFFGAPVVLWVFVHKKLLPFSAHDAGLMVQTLVLSAQSRGIGSCALGVLATWRGPVDAEFAIPEDYQLITGLALGYASDDHVNTFRAEHPELVRVPSR
ncbi:MAG TPA: nitroreductase [Propionibacteriaceae bacterium]|nr:nitroreductase [Propionibacteriaceae bacterium]